jgi:hypothetical protein
VRRRPKWNLELHRLKPRPHLKLKSTKRPRRKEKGERKQPCADRLTLRPKLNLTLHRLKTSPHLKENSTIRRARLRPKLNLMLHWVTPRLLLNEIATMRRATRRMRNKCARYVNILPRPLAEWQLAPPSTATRSNADGL